MSEVSDAVVVMELLAKILQGGISYLVNISKANIALVQGIVKWQQAHTIKKGEVPLNKLMKETGGNITFAKIPLPEGASREFVEQLFSQLEECAVRFAQMPNFSGANELVIAFSPVDAKRVALIVEKYEGELIGAEEYINSQGQAIGSPAKEGDLNELLNHLTEYDYAHDDEWIVCAADNPEKHIALTTRQDTYNNQTYSKTDYRVYNGDELVYACHDGRFDGRPKHFWYDLKKQMAAKMEVGMNSKFLLFKSVDGYKSYLAMSEEMPKQAQGQRKQETTDPVSGSQETEIPVSDNLDAIPDEATQGTAEITLPKPAEKGTLNDLLNHLTERNYAHDDEWIVCASDDAQKHIAMTTERAVYRGKGYSKTTYRVYDGADLVRTYNDGRFEGRAKNFWFNLKGDMAKNLGQKPDDQFLFFRSADEYQNYIGYMQEESMDGNIRSDPHKEEYQEPAGQNVIKQKTMPDVKDVWNGKTKKPNTKNRFNDFPQREDDFDAMEALVFGYGIPAGEASIPQDTVRRGEDTEKQVEVQTDLLKQAIQTVEERKKDIEPQTEYKNIDWEKLPLEIKPGKEVIILADMIVKADHTSAVIQISKDEYIRISSKKIKREDFSSIATIQLDSYARLVDYEGRDLKNDRRFIDENELEEQIKSFCGDKNDIIEMSKKEISIPEWMVVKSNAQMSVIQISSDEFISVPSDKFRREGDGKVAIQTGSYARLTDSEGQEISKGSDKRFIEADEIKEYIGKFVNEKEQDTVVRRGESL